MKFYAEVARHITCAQVQLDLSASAAEAADKVLLEEILPKLRDGIGLKVIDVVMDPRDVPEKAKAGLLRGSEASKP